MSALRRSVARAGAAFLGALFVILGMGCATRAEFIVLASANPEIPFPRTYVLSHAAALAPKDGLRIQERVEIIKSALATRGMYQAPGPAAADVVIHVETRVEGPLMKLLETSDTYYTGKPVNSDSNMEQLVNFRDETIEILYYKTTLVLTARENISPAGDAGALAWNVEIAAETEENDLRAVLPALAAAAADYIGAETEGQEATTQRLARRARPLGPRAVVVGK